MLVETLKDVRIVVDAEIVHDEHVARLQAGQKLRRHVGSPARCVQASSKGLVAENSVVRNRADDGEVLAPRVRSIVDDRLATRPPPVAPRHRSMHAGLVEEDETFPRNAPNDAQVPSAELLDFLTEYLPRPEPFFFQVMSALRSVRPIAAVLMETP